MTPRARRLVAAAATLVLLLFAGRWLVTFLAARWWAAAISPDALQAVTRWQLLGLALDLGAVGIASAWFAAQALLVARAIGSVQVERRIGDLRVREAIPVRLLLVGAIGTGLLLGILTGVGAAAWRAPVALAWQGVHFGIEDPLLGVDLGVLLVRYPVWRLAHHFALLLVVLGITFTLMLYLGIGALRRREGRVDLHADARRHLGWLLATLGAVIAVGYLLAPYRLATAIDVPLSPVAATTRVLAAHAAAGAAIAVAVISIGWALRPRHSLLAASWAVLGLAAVTERLVVPAFVAESAAATDHDETTRRWETLLYGINLGLGSRGSDTLPPTTTIWDPDALARWAEQRGGVFLGSGQRGVGSNAMWLVATGFPGEPGSVELSEVVAGVSTPGGMPMTTAGDSSRSTLLRDPIAIPAARPWRAVGERRGVVAGGPLRRAALAWALQAPGILGVAPDAVINWALDPRERLARLVPGLSWHAVGLTWLDGRLAWLVSGLVPLPRAPLTTRVPMGERQVAGLRPALLGVVYADDASARIFVDPVADSLGLAWARGIGRLVESADQMPAALRLAMPYPGVWLEAQLKVLERAHWGMGRRPDDPLEGGMLPFAPTWGADGPVLQALFEEPARQMPTFLLEAGRRGGLAWLASWRLAGEPTPGSIERSRSWRRVLGFAHARDSVRAAGDTLLAGPLRHHMGLTGLVSWQPFHSAGRRGDPALLWIGTAHGGAVAGGRRTVEAWNSVLGLPGDASATAPFDLMGRFEAVRSWISRADSALARGDLTAFARAWEAVRGLLLEPPRE